MIREIGLSWLCAVAVIGILTIGCTPADTSQRDAVVVSESSETIAPTTGATTATGYATPVLSVLVPAGPIPNDELVLVPIVEIGGKLAPKSVVASGTGLYFAQNMMFVHTVSVFDAGKELVATVEDAVELAAFGYDVGPTVHRGAPVEAAFTTDGSFAFVSNYRMYGPGYDPMAGGDSCAKDDGEHSFVYRIDTVTLEIDRVYRVGPVPKSVAVTPDDRLLLVSNWCGFDVSVIDLKSGETLAEVEVGRHPRGIAVSSDSTTAYVAVMGSTDVAVIDLVSALSSDASDGTLGGTSVLSYFEGVGLSPRDLVLSTDDEILYVSLNDEDAVVAIDAGTGQEFRRASTGIQPRSLDISDDGTALYVVNYGSATISKLRTSDFAILQSFDTAQRPIGITYDSFNDEVWVSAYSGIIHVYAEKESAEHAQCLLPECEVDPSLGQETRTQSRDRLEPGEPSSPNSSTRYPDHGPPDGHRPTPTPPRQP